MLNARERRIQAIVLFLTLALHAFILCVLFVLTRREDFEPLRITAEPQLIEYLLNSVTQQPYNQPAQHTATLPNMSPALAKALQQITPAPVPNEPGYDSYTLKNAISQGSFTNGSVVTMGQEYGNPKDNGNQAEPLQESPEPAQKDPAVKQDQQDINAEPAQQQIEAEQVAEQPAGNQDSSAEPEEQVPTNEGSPEELRQDGIDPMTGTSQIIAQAEEIINDSGSSWITKSQRSVPVNIGLQPHTGTKIVHQVGTGSSKIPNQSKNSKKALTLADITRSYVKHAYQEQVATSRYSYNKSGSPTGTVSRGAYAPPTSGIALSEQLYASKLYNLLEQSALAYSKQIYSCGDLDMQTVIEVTIEKSGKILDVALNPALPEKDMEQALCLIVKRVGLFPPIPRQFHKQRIILSIPIRIRSKQGFASYRLLYGLNTA